MFASLGGGRDRRDTSLPDVRDRPSRRRERDLLPLLRAARADLRLGGGRARRDAGADRGGAALALAVRAAPAGGAAGGRRRRPRLDAARPGAAARGPARARRGPPEARPLEPDALLQGPRRRRRGREGGGVR